MKKLWRLSLLFFIPALSMAQVTRQPQPLNKAVIATPSRNVKTDTVPVRNNAKPPTISVANKPLVKIKPAVSVNSMTAPSNLKWYNYYVASDPDVKPPVWLYEYHAGEFKYITGKSEKAQWKTDFLWHHIPAKASSAKVEISSLPFSTENESKFAAVVETKIIPRTNSDSVKFNISYTEKVTSGGQSGTNGKISPVMNNAAGFKLSYSKALLDDLTNYGNYYVRLTPLDGRGQPIGKSGNTIKIVPDYINFPPPPVPTSEDSLQSDYEITAVNYIQMHYPEGKFADCIVVTGYNESTSIGPLGNSWENQLIGTFKQVFPVGTVLCPSPPKESSWYEKAFNSVADAVTIGVNGASKLYSDTKNYLKKKFSEYMCNYDPTVSTNKKLLEKSGASKQTIDDGCATATGVAFEMAMSYAGMPPSIPNFDEMCKLAKGQLVEMLIQKAVEQTGMPCDETCAALIAEGFDKIVEESAKQNMQNGGFFLYKPDSRGQYRLPYIEIEVTRKRMTQKGEKLMPKLNFTPGVEKTFSLTDINGKGYTTTISSYDLYEKIQLPVPYLKTTGDKIKLIAVLTPKIAFLVTTCSEKRVSGISPTQQLCLGFNTIEQVGDDPKKSSGYSSMVENATITINPAGKIKLAEGVNTKFVHHQ